MSSEVRDVLNGTEAHFLAKEHKCDEVGCEVFADIAILRPIIEPLADAPEHLLATCSLSKQQAIDFAASLMAWLRDKGQT